MAESKTNLDEFHYHEALDRSHTILVVIEELLVNHPVIENHKGLNDKIQKISTLLSEVYQEVGRLSIADL